MTHGKIDFTNATDRSAFALQNEWDTSLMKAPIKETGRTTRHQSIKHEKVTKIPSNRSLNSQSNEIDHDAP